MNFGIAGTEGGRLPRTPGPDGVQRGTLFNSTTVVTRLILQYRRFQVRGESFSSGRSSQTLKSGSRSSEGREAEDGGGWSKDRGD